MDNSKNLVCFVQSSEKSNIQTFYPAFILNCIPFRCKTFKALCNLLTLKSKNLQKQTNVDNRQRTKNLKHSTGSYEDHSVDVVFADDYDDGGIPSRD